MLSQSDLIALLSYYLAIVAILVAFFSVQVDGWMGKVAVTCPRSLLQLF